MSKEIVAENFDFSSKPEKKSINESIKELRDKRKAEGLCIECAMPSDKTRCVNCRRKNAEITQRRREEGKITKPTVEKQAEYNKRSYDKRCENGICIVCGKPTETGLLRCVECNEKSNTRNRDRRVKLAAEGKCRECGKEA